MNALPGLGHFPTSVLATPRFREAGDLTLDLAHHDARVEDRWLGLNPREFAILWRLADRPGEEVCEAALSADLWRVRFGLEVGDIALHVAHLCAKLAAVGLADLVAAAAGGGYAITTRAAGGLLPGPCLRGH